MLSKLEQARELAETEPDHAMRLCSEVLDEHLDDIHAQQALFMSAYIMMKAERYGLAYNIYKRCAELNPKLSEIYSNMGMCVEVTRPDEAIQLFRKAQRLNPENPRPLANEGLIALHKANPERCEYLSNQALKLEPDLDSAKQNKALALLMQRKWTEGWPLFFETLGIDSRKMRDYGCEEWTPNSEPGTVVVYGEQGVGDEIMYASCLKELHNDGFEIIIDTDSRLEKLFKRSFPYCTVYGDRFKEHSRVLDYHSPKYQCALGQLPAKYRLSEESFKCDPYLIPSNDWVTAFSAMLNLYEGKKIGVAWSGGNPNTHQKKRTICPDDFAPLFETNNTFVCLEYKPVSDNIIQKYGLKCFPDVTGKGQPIDKLAALIASLDVVFTSCTTVVYIAGALGIPCHVLVPKEPGYRYHKEGGFPWYESVTLHRFKDSWQNTIEEAVKCYECS